MRAKVPGLLALAGLLVACSGQGGDATEGPIGEGSTSRPVDADALELAAADEPTDLHLTALVGGTVELDDRGCVVLVDSERVNHTFWPFGTRPVDADTLELADGRRVDVGDEITAEGGYVSKLVARHDCLSYEGTTVIISEVDEID